MKKIIALFLALGSISAFASSSDRVSVEIKADSKELCESASDSISKGDLEGDLRKMGAHVTFISVCNKGLDGRYRLSVRFAKPNQDN
jgi:hypothetical protein